MELQGDLAKDKLALFRDFLKVGENVSTLLTMRREFQQQIAMEQGWVYAKKRDLQLPPFNLPKEKAEQLVKSSEWIPDPNFPDDEEERMYWVRERIALRDT